MLDNEPQNGSASADVSATGVRDLGTPATAALSVDAGVPAIRAIGLLAAIERGELKEDHPISTAILQKQIASRRALYVAVLLHDIAKGRGECEDAVCPLPGMVEVPTWTGPGRVRTLSYLRGNGPHPRRHGLWPGRHRHLQLHPHVTARRILTYKSCYAA